MLRAHGQNIAKKQAHLKSGRSSHSEKLKQYVWINIPKHTSTLTLQITLSFQIMCLPVIINGYDLSWLSHQIFFSANVLCLHPHQALPPPLWRVNKEQWLVCLEQVFSQRFRQHPLLFEEDKYIQFMAPLWLKQTQNFILVNSLMDWSVQFWKATDGTNERHWRIKQILTQCMTSRVMTRCLEGFLFWCGLLGAAKKTMVWQKADKTADISCY